MLYQRLHLPLLSTKSTLPNQFWLSKLNGPRPAAQVGPPNYVARYGPPAYIYGTEYVSFMLMEINICNIPLTRFTQPKFKLSLVHQ